MRRHFSRHSRNDDEKKKGKNTRSAPALTLLVTPPQRSPWASSLPFSLALFCAQTIWYHLTAFSSKSSNLSVQHLRASLPLQFAQECMCAAVRRCSAP